MISNFHGQMPSAILCSKHTIPRVCPEFFLTLYPASQLLLVSCTVPSKCRIFKKNVENLKKNTMYVVEWQVQTIVNSANNNSDSRISILAWRIAIKQEDKFQSRTGKPREFSVSTGISCLSLELRQPAIKCPLCVIVSPLVCTYSTY